MISTKFFRHFPPTFNKNLHCKFQNDRIYSFRDIKNRPKFQFKMAALPLTPEPSNSIHLIIHVYKILNKKFQSIPYRSFGEIGFGKYGRIIIKKIIIILTKTIDFTICRLWNLIIILTKTIDFTICRLWNLTRTDLDQCCDFTTKRNHFMMLSWIDM